MVPVGWPCPSSSPRREWGPGNTSAPERPRSTKPACNRDTVCVTARGWWARAQVPSLLGRTHWLLLWAPDSNLLPAEPTHPITTRTTQTRLGLPFLFPGPGGAYQDEQTSQTPRTPALPTPEPAAALPVPSSSSGISPPRVPRGHPISWSPAEDSQRRALPRHPPSPEGPSWERNSPSSDPTVPATLAGAGRAGSPPGSCLLMGLSDPGTRGPTPLTSAWSTWPVSPPRSDPCSSLRIPGSCPKTPGRQSGCLAGPGPAAQVLTSCPVRRQGQGSAFPARRWLRHRSVGARAARAPGNEAVRLGVRGDPPRRALGLWVRWPWTPLTYLALSQVPTCEPHIRGWGAGEKRDPAAWAGRQSAGCCPWQGCGRTRPCDGRCT